MGFLDTSGVQYLWTKLKTFLDGKVSNTRTINGKALNANITLTADDVNAVSSSLVGVANGIATLDSSGKILTSQLPSSVDEILEYEKLSVFPTTGVESKIYVDKTSNKTYRWGGSEYVEISASLAIGTTSSTAGRGDLTQTAYEHSQSVHAPYNAEANVQSDWSESDTTSDAYIKNKPTTMRANGGNADTVNGYTVNSNVPSGAKFTDTTYSNATTSAAGLMSAEDKVKLNGITGTGSYVLPTASSSTLGGVKTTSTVTSTSGLTACPIINGVPYYKDTDTNTTYSAITNAEIDAIFES